VWTAPAEPDVDISAIAMVIFLEGVSVAYVRYG
jgi:hypothetical protein